MNKAAVTSLDRNKTIFFPLSLRDFATSHFSRFLFPPSLFFFSFPLHSLSKDKVDLKNPVSFRFYFFFFARLSAIPIVFVRAFACKRVVLQSFWRLTLAPVRPATFSPPLSVSLAPVSKLRMAVSPVSADRLTVPRLPASHTLSGRTLP